MAKKYVSSIKLSLTNEEITDFQTVKLPTRILRQLVELNSGVGFIEIENPVMNNIEIAYVVPANTPEFDFDPVVNARLTVDRKNGSRLTFTGVSTLQVDGETYERNGESVRTITLMAEKFKKE